MLTSLWLFFAGFLVWKWNKDANQRLFLEQYYCSKYTDLISTLSPKYHNEIRRVLLMSQAEVLKLGNSTPTFSSKHQHSQTPTMSIKASTLTIILHLKHTTPQNLSWHTNILHQMLTFIVKILQSSNSVGEICCTDKRKQDDSSVPIPNVFLCLILMVRLRNWKARCAVFKDMDVDDDMDHKEKTPISTWPFSLRLFSYDEKYLSIYHSLFTIAYVNG